MAGKPQAAPESTHAAVRSARRLARELVLQGLYQSLVSGNDEAAIEAHLLDSEGFDKADREFFTGLLRGVLAQRRRLECPCHEGYFSVEDGHVIQGPPPRPLPRIELERSGGQLYASGVTVFGEEESQ